LPLQIILYLRIWHSSPVAEESHEILLKKACLLSDDNDDVWNRKLDTYYRLKKKLEEESSREYK
jgi:hypothetical protein